MTAIPPEPISTLLAPPTPPPTRGGSELGRDEFLQLLVAQLRYQDPLNPSDGAEFIAQTAQLTSVETLEELSALTEQSLGLQQRWSSAALVGREVTATGGDGAPVTGTVVSVLLGDADPVLRVRTATGAEVEAPLADVTSIADPAAAPTARPTGSADPG